jgi:hypothetical protein
MSAVATITKLATDVVGRTAHVVTHPVGTVSAVAEKARGIASSVRGQSKGPATTPEAPADPSTESSTGSAAGSATGSSAESSTGSSAADFGDDTLPEPVVIEPTETQEPFVTEPKPASREAAHTGRGEDPGDDWHDELDDGHEAKTSAGTTGVAPDINPATGLPHQPGE